MSYINKSQKQEKEKPKNQKTLKKKKNQKPKNEVIIINCVCHKNMWCDHCYGEYDLFD